MILYNKAGLLLEHLRHPAFLGGNGMEKKHFYVVIHILFLILFFKAILTLSPIFKRLPLENIFFMMGYPFLLGLYLSYPNILLLSKNKKEKLVVDVSNLVLAIFSLLVVLVSIINFFIASPVIVSIFGLIQRHVGTNVTYFSLLLGFFLPKSFRPSPETNETNW